MKILSFLSRSNVIRLDRKSLTFAIYMIAQQSLSCDN